MIFIVGGTIWAMALRKKYKNSHNFMAILVFSLGIILGCFLPTFWGNQDILNSAELYPVYGEDIYLIMQDGSYYFNCNSKDNIWHNGTLDTRFSNTDIKVIDSDWYQIRYCVETPRHELWVYFFSFGLLPVSHNYYEIYVPDSAILRK